MRALMAGVEDPRFAVDRPLGRLARWLRRLGYDAVWRPELDRHRVETFAAREGRVLLTRARARGRSPARAATLVLASSDFRSQLREIDRVYPLGGAGARAARCLACNVPLAAVPEAVGAQRCPSCRREFRPGGATRRMEAELDALSLRGPGAL